MIDPTLLSILCCPETRQDLAVADIATVKAFNEKVAAGTARNRTGAVVAEPVESLLVRADGLYGYAVRDGIPVMLIEEALPLP